MALMNTSTVEGSLDIQWANYNEPSATPKYRLLFARYEGFQGGAQPSKQITGTDALQAYLIELGFETVNAKNWIKQVQEKVSVAIPNVILEQEQLAPYLVASA